MPPLLRINLFAWTAFTLIVALSAVHYGLSETRNTTIALIIFTLSLIPVAVHRYGPNRSFMRRGITLYASLSVAVCAIALCGAAYRIAIEHLPVFG